MAGGGGWVETDRERFKCLNHGEFIVHTKTKTSGWHNERKSLQRKCQTSHLTKWKFKPPRTSKKTKQLIHIYTKEWQGGEKDSSVSHKNRWNKISFSLPARRKQYD